MIVEYELNTKESGRTSVPEFITNGGYFRNGEKLIGIAPDGTDLPENATALDRAALITRLVDMGWDERHSSPAHSYKYAPSTVEEIGEAVDWFINAYDT